MDLNHVNLDRAKLAAKPKNERVLLLLLAHARNEINVLTKLLMMLRKDKPASPIIAHAEAGQSFIFMRLLIGKLHEAWELFRTRVQSDRAISLKYIPNLSHKAASARQELNRHFGQDSVLTKIRNQISFHYTDDADLVEAIFQRLPATEPVQFYMAKTVVNTFFQMGELVAQFSAINLMKPVAANPNDSSSAEARALNALWDVMILVSFNIIELFDEMIGRLGADVVGDVTTVQIPDPPKLSDFPLPYFFDEG